MNIKSLIFAAVLVAVAAANPAKNANKGVTINGFGRVSPLNFDHTRSLVTWYDCSGKVDGNYIHPNDCTKFMSCVAQAYAYERNCADCHVDERECPTGRLHYDLPRDSCLWAYEAGCVTDGGNQTEPVPTTTASPPKPTTADPGNEDNSCNPDDCWTEGYCQDYRWCERDASDHKGTGKNGTWSTADCEDNLYFNPNHNSIHGGTCDFWENLDDETKDNYNKDPTCIDPHCEWKPDSTTDCSSKYWYFHPAQNNGQDQEMSCPVRADGQQLIWNQEKKSCYPCHQVAKAGDSGEMCC